MAEQKYDQEQPENEQAVHQVDDVPDYERVNLSQNKKEALGCYACFAIVGIIIIIIMKLANPNLISLWWLVLPIAALVLLYSYAQRYEKLVTKVALAHKCVLPDWKFQKGIKKCFDLQGTEEKQLPDQDLYLHKWMWIVDKEKVEGSCEGLQRILDALENTKILVVEKTFLTAEELKKAIQQYGGDEAKDLEITIFKATETQYHKKKNRDKFDVIDYQEMAWVTFGDFDECMGWDTNVVPAAGWKVEHTDSATVRVFHIGTLLGDLACFIVTGCAKYDITKPMTPSDEKLYNALNRIMQKLFTRADERSDQLRVLLDKAREKANATDGRKARQSGEHMRQEIADIRRAVYGPGNYDAVDANKAKKGNNNWCWITIVVLVVVGLLVYFFT